MYFVKTATSFRKNKETIKRNKEHTMFDNEIRLVIPTPLTPFYYDFKLMVYIVQLVFN